MDTVRATLIFILLLFHGVFAMPWFHEVKPHELQRPEAKQEVRQWREMLNSFGIALEQDEFNDLLIDISSRLVAPNKWVKARLRPIMSATGTGQGWGLFVTPDTYPHRLIVEGRGDGDPAFNLIYQRLNSDFDWWDERFRYRRVRGIYDGATSKPNRAYLNFCRWVAESAFQEHSEYEVIRVGFIRTHSVPPGKERDDREPRRLLRTFKRSDFES